jgi:hypothetical protein
MLSTPPMLVFSTHADTNFLAHSLRKKDDGYLGFLDNFAGVHATMRAYFSGRIQGNHTRIVLTDHEETTFAGAFELREQLTPTDLVVVVDVTGIVGEWDFTIEKCRNSKVKQFLEKTLQGSNYVLFSDSPDPIAEEDEVNVYSEKCPYTFFLGVPCSGGDYNAEPVFCKEKSIQAVSDAIIAISQNYTNF